MYVVNCVFICLFLVSSKNVMLASIKDPNLLIPWRNNYLTDNKKSCACSCKKKMPLLWHKKTKKTKKEPRFRALCTGNAVHAVQIFVCQQLLDP